MLGNDSTDSSDSCHREGKITLLCELVHVGFLRDLRALKCNLDAFCRNMP